jgi:hypothetical protein
VATHQEFNDVDEFPQDLRDRLDPRVIEQLRGQGPFEYVKGPADQDLTLASISHRTGPIIGVTDLAPANASGGSRWNVSVPDAESHPLMDVHHDLIGLRNRPDLTSDQAAQLDSVIADTALLKDVDYADSTALKPEFDYDPKDGTYTPRNAATVTEIPAGTDVEYLRSKTAPQLSELDQRAMPGGLDQYYLVDYDHDACKQSVRDLMPRSERHETTVASATRTDPQDLAQFGQLDARQRKQIIADPNTPPQMAKDYAQYEAWLDRGATPDRGGDGRDGGGREGASAPTATGETTAADVLSEQARSEVIAADLAALGSQADLTSGGSADTPDSNPASRTEASALAEPTAAAEPVAVVAAEPTAAEPPAAAAAEPAAAAAAEPAADSTVHDESTVAAGPTVHADSGPAPDPDTQ